MPVRVSWPGTRRIDEALHSLIPESDLDEAESMQETMPSLSERGPNPPADEDLQLTRIDHYVLLRRVGQGAMGVVYAAYDEQLDRKVAIKLLHAETRSTPRLQREAQALARLSHPHVVQVYEVGEFDDAPFIAMEFVEGETLRAWIAHTCPSQAEILAVARAAGQGLIAAHDKGLVHRDFKPDNVMVGVGGRVVVMDFGLARGKGSQRAEAQGSALDEFDEFDELDRSASLLPAELTMTGAVMGTPAYMAPEQYRGVETGPATDQFSFCVTVWEALCGRRPFSGDNLFALQQAVSTGEIQATTKLPSWLRRVLERGLAPEPEARWPSMEALLEALADDPTRRRRALGVVAVCGLALAVGGVSVARISETRRAEAAASARARIEASCTARADALATSWNDDTRAQHAAAFASTERGAAGQAWLQTDARLDRYARDWSAARMEVCLDAELPERGGVEPELRARMLTCFDERRVVFEALLEVWSSVEEGTVTRAPAAAAELPLIASCSDPSWLGHQIPPPDDTETRAQVLALRVRLEHVAALNLAADYAKGLEQAASVLAEAEALAWVPLIAEARFAHGALLERNGKFEASREQLRRAFFEAGDAGHDLVALQSASKLVWTVGVRLRERDQALLWSELAEMFIARVGLESSVHEAKWLNARAAFHFLHGDNELALRSYQRALEIRRAELGPDHPLVGGTLNNIGLAERALGRPDDAMRSLQAALEIRVESLGANHPAVAGSRNNLSMIYTGKKRYIEALDQAQQGLDILIPALGPEHPQVGSGWNNVGVIHGHLGAYEDALAAHERGLAIKRAVLGPDHALTAVAHTYVAQALYGLGELEQARARLDQVYACHDEGLRQPMHRAMSAFLYAQVLDALGEQPERARELAESAAADLDEASEPVEERIAKVEAWLGEHPRD